MARGPFRPYWSLLAVLAGAVPGFSSAAAAAADAAVAEAHRWAEAAFAKPRAVPPAVEVGEALCVLRQSHKVLPNQSVWGTPLKLGDRQFAQGLYLDAPAAVRVRVARPAAELTAFVGIDNNTDTQRNPGAGSARFHVAAGGQRLLSTPVRRLADGATPVRVPLRGAREFLLEVDDGDDGRGWDQCVWAEPTIKFQDGSTCSLATLPLQSAPPNRSNCPVSFTFGGSASERLLSTWDYTTQTRPASDRCDRLVSYKDAQTGLLVECSVTTYPDSAGVDWVCHLTNTGAADSPLVEHFVPLDADTLGAADEPSGDVVLRWSNGDRCAADSFLPHDEPLTKGARRQFTGHSSDTTCLPFFNLKLPHGGWIVAIGWTGRWAAEFSRDDDGRVRVRAGMAQTGFRLKPGERVRGPRIVLLRYRGEEMIGGHNQFRRMLLGHYVPRHEGKPISPPVAYTSVAALWLKATRTKQPLGRLTEASELAMIPRAAALGCEAYWMDAYWFPQPWWEKNLGNWYPRPEDYPRGLRPLADAAHERGLQFILWFAPLHVSPGTRWAREHPQYVHGGAQGGGWKLGDLPARQFLVDWLSRQIADWGVDVYREDFGTPLPGDEGPDRIGIAEMRQIEGFYAFWSELLRRNPGLRIDNCSGGGRRIDIETVSRACTLWRSDFNDVGEGLKDRAHWPQMGRADQVMVTGLSLYFPLHTGPVWDMRPYSFRSAMTAGIVVYTDIERPEFSADQARQAIAELKQLRPLFLGDIYPLLDVTTSQSAWYAYQLDRPDLGQGCVLVFRRPESPEPVRTLGLRAIDPAAHYLVSITGETYDHPPGRPMTGLALRQQRVQIDARPGSALIRYQRLPSDRASVPR
jgi:alpha-galactosidase